MYLLDLATLNKEKKLKPLNYDLLLLLYILIVQLRLWIFKSPWGIYMPTEHCASSNMISF